jgi:hypothetical protein
MLETDISENHYTTSYTAQDAWRWDGDCLRHFPYPDDLSYHDYWIDLERFTTPAKLSGWLWHMGQKLWITREDLIVLTQQFMERNYATKQELLAAIPGGFHNV